MESLARLQDRAAAAQAHAQSPHALLPAFLLCLASCAEAEPATQSILWHRDITGVPITINNEPLHAGTWTLDSAADVIVLADAGAELHAVSDVAFLSDNRIVVADHANAQVVLFDSTGRPLRRIGRAGNGPGEFRSVRRIRVGPGDTITVLDPIHRVLRFEAGGESAGQQPLPQRALETPISSYPWRHVFPLGEGRVLTALDERPVETEHGRPLWLYGVMQPGGKSVIDTIGWFPGPLQSGPAAEAKAFVQASPNTLFAAGSTHLYIGDSQTYEIGQYDMRGELLRRIRRIAERVPVNALDREFALDWLEARPPPNGGADVVFAPSHPAYSQLLVDAQDRLWVHEAPRDPKRQYQNWAVYDTAGTLLRDVVLPFGFDQVRAIGTDRVLSRSANDLLIPVLRVHRLADQHMH